LTSPACDWFVQASKDENEPEPSETLQEKTRTIAETISDLYYQIANLDSQKEALKSANAELLELSQNCPECQEYCEIADAVEGENTILHDHNASLVKDKGRMLSEINTLVDENSKMSDTFLEQAAKLRKELLAEKSWQIGMKMSLANRDRLVDELRDHNASLVKDKERMLSEINASRLAPEREREIITNLQKKLQAEAKENEILAGSLLAAESALGIREAAINELVKENADLVQDYDLMRDRLTRAEAAYMELVDARSGTATTRMITREICRAQVKGY
jgi:chromosome segregation ATPase